MEKLLKAGPEGWEAVSAFLLTITGYGGVTSGQTMRVLFPAIEQLREPASSSSEKA